MKVTGINQRSVDILAWNLELMRDGLPDSYNVDTYYLGQEVAEIGSQETEEEWECLPTLSICQACLRPIFTPISPEEV